MSALPSTGEDGGRGSSEILGLGILLLVAGGFLMLAGRHQNQGP